MAINYPFWIKAVIGILGFVYVVYYLLKMEENTIKISPDIEWKNFWVTTIVKLFFIAIITSLYVWYSDSNQLFIVLRTKPILWLVILFVYSLLSVYPQELIYRTFFFQRYQSLIKNENFFIFLNAIIFSLGHLFFKNTLVIILTFLGGLLFAYTYNKTKSTLLVSIEHALYGSWLFTVGMGSMLGFPS
jgi:membrane protease YdiL (CAAX protease family)